jgi:hypothetical protein
MKTVEWDGTQWCLVLWKEVGFLTRQGQIIQALKSARREDAETEAMLQGWL